MHEATIPMKIIDFLNFYVFKNHGQQKKNDGRLFDTRNRL